MITMLGDSSDDRMAVSGVKWLHKLGCNVLTMSPSKQDYGHHNYPLERFDHAIKFLKAQGNRKIGIARASTTGMLAPVAASYFHDISLTLAMCPCTLLWRVSIRMEKMALTSVRAIMNPVFPGRVIHCPICHMLTDIRNTGRKSRKNPGKAATKLLPAKCLWNPRESILYRNVRKLRLRISKAR